MKNSSAKCNAEDYLNYFNCGIWVRSSAGVKPEHAYQKAI